MTQRLLFGGTQGASSQSKYLVEFRAGKCTKNGKLVTPDKRKGLCFIHQTEDSLTHFCWKDRTTNQVEDDFILFPNDAEFIKVPQCTTGRVFVLKFNDKLCFYWMQEPKEDKDDEFRTKVNQLLNETSRANSFNEASEEGDISNFISGMSHRELATIFNNLGSNNALPALLSTVRRQRPTNTDDSTMDVDTPAGGTSSKTKSGSKSSSAAAKPTNLTEALKGESAAASSSSANQNQQADALMGALTQAETLEPIINNTELMARVKEFLPQTEAGKHSDVPNQVSMTIKSPQFQQAVAMFSAALMSGQMGPLMTQFGMSSDVAAAAATGNLEEFLKALEKSQKKSSTDAEMKE